MQPNAAESDLPVSRSAPNALASLRRFARARKPAERCELCGAELTPEHQHLLDRNSRQAVCSCTACAILFCGQQGAKFLRIPRRILKLHHFSIPDAQWDSLMLPINLAFFLPQPDGSTRAMYPSPAGAMESSIALPTWAALCGQSQTLSAAEPEVEALLVNRLPSDAAYFLVPIDVCYRLVGLIRTNWRGLSGGGEVRQAIAGFFDDLEKRAITPGESHHA